MEKRKLAVIVPAYNEAEVLERTLESLIEVIQSQDIYIVSDGSSDHTIWKARSFTPNVLEIKVNVGKAQAMNEAIRHFKLVDNYEYIMPMDADTKITKQFIEYALPVLDKDIEKKNICVVGKVTGRTHNKITLYRMWEYEIAQTIHKAAQAKENALIVCPGCATVYRSELFKSIEIPSGTMTEDMDLTFYIHRKRLGKIAYEPRALVITQDPHTIHDYIAQLQRWYIGFWQCLIKHNVPWEGQTLDLEVAALAVEGLFNGLLMVFMIILIPIVLVIKPILLVPPFLIDLCFFFLPSLMLLKVRKRLRLIVRYLYYFYFMRLISSYIFLLSFIKVIFAVDYRMGWKKVARY